MKVSIYDRFRALYKKQFHLDMLITGRDVLNLFLAIYKVNPEKEKRTVLNVECLVCVYPLEFVPEMDTCIKSYMQSDARKARIRRIAKKRQQAKELIKQEPQKQVVIEASPAPGTKRVRQRIKVNHQKVSRL